MTARLRDTDSAERSFQLRVYAATVPLSLLAAIGVIVLQRSRGLLPPGAATWVLLAGLVVGIVSGTLVLWATGRISQGFVAVLLGAGNLPPAPSFSLQDSLVMRGRPDEAAEAYRRHLAANPGDHDARLALAAVLDRHLADPDGAAAVLGEIRRLAPDDDRLEWRVSQELIDLYRRVGNRGRLMAELARFADRRAGTRPGEAARAELRRMKAEASAGER
ncbi:MAG: tetratricopeptide repeat protein [Gemmatimonadales bacterium]